MKNVFFYVTKLGDICISEKDGAITNVDFFRKTAEIGEIIEETAPLKEADMQLQEYFLGKRTEFNLPLAPEGTPFQQKVWKALQEIPYGQTRSYGEIARGIGNSKASRAVGMANNKNPLAIFIPCHRVIGANGNLVGYAGGIEVKKILLSLEKEVLDGKNH